MPGGTDVGATYRRRFQDRAVPRAVRAHRFQLRLGDGDHLAFGNGFGGAGAPSVGSPRSHRRTQDTRVTAMAGTSMRRMFLWTPVVVGVAATLVWLFRPTPVAVDIAEATRGAMQVTISDEGEARVRDVFVVSAPVAGLMRRVELEAGDHVIANETVVA